MASHLTIAIDGPAGAGKSTVAKTVARRLGLLYVDTGAMYRAAAYLAVKYGVPTDDESAIVDLLNRHPLSFERRSDDTLQILVDGVPVQDELRTPEVSSVVSPLSAHPRVRTELTRIQRQLSEHQGVVMDGRDIGTVVLPNAALKVFLTASLAERAARRAQELRAKGHEVRLSDLQRAIDERDAQDASRHVAPLRPAPDARILDSTGKPVEAVVQEILEWAGEVRGVE